MSILYDCIIVGGGIAGLQAAIQLGRYNHRIAVIDCNNGRSTLCRSYHNILGWPNGVSGEELRQLGKEHAQKYGVQFIHDKVISIGKAEKAFIIQGETGEKWRTYRILLATGVMDRLPPIKNIKKCLGLSIYVCPDCDGYEVKGKQVIVLGAGETGANLALTLLYWTKDIIYINHDGEELTPTMLTHLTDKGITYIKEPILEAIVINEADFKGVRLQNLDIISAERGFIGFGGNEVRTDLAQEIGVERLENRHIIVDPRTKKTNVENVWAAGDIAVHSEQTTIAMGDGMQAAIWIHKSIIED